jgi:LysM repeat protein
LKSEEQDRDMEDQNEERMEPKVEVFHDLEEYEPPSRSARPFRSIAPPKWIFVIILLVIIGSLGLVTWVVLPPGIFVTKREGESLEQKAFKEEFLKLKSGTDSLKKDIQLLQEGQKGNQEQLKGLQGQVKGLQDQITMLISRSEFKNNKKSPSPEVTYRVKRGDDLRSIAKKFHVRPEEIRRWNRFSKNGLKPGQAITLYPPTVR